ncbi:sensor histidine kinase [Actinoplanes subtropicus]|uniref:sensor histidine kinase n=1 Tax=Actinoplanes subtropicus TaxID=543632 RepID=UPI000690938A|nr:histidine kinase [Actinoplanes subtropicus]
MTPEPGNGWKGLADAFRTRWSPLSLIPGLALGGVVLAATLVAAAPQTDRHATRLAETLRHLGGWGGTLVVVTVAVTVALLRAAPLAALAAAVVLVDVYLLLHFPYGPIQLCIVVAMYEVARRRPFPVSLVTCGIAAAISSTVVYVRLADELELPWALALAWTGWLIVPWLLGALVQTVALSRERGRRELITRGAMAERVKLAAEVHDVAGHGFALVAMQAGVALLDFDARPAQARRSLEAIRTTSATSLTALRAMLGTVHNGTDTEESPPVEQSPDRGLSGVIELVDGVRASGLPVRLDLHCLDRTPATGAAAVTYRVVRESLTNVLRHAGPTTAEVSIAQHDDWLVVCVQDRGRGLTGEPSGAASGLAGMRRRVEAAGGSLAAGPRADGGFRVEARLPIGKEPR